MKDNNRTTSSGIGVTGLLGVAFVVLKLCGIINWSWLWVLSPFWISAILVVVTIVVLIIIDKRDKKIINKKIDDAIEKMKAGK